MNRPRARPDLAERFRLVVARGLARSSVATGLTTALLLLLAVAPAWAGVESDGTSGQHLGGVGGGTQASGTTNSSGGWFKVTTNLGNDGYLLLRLDNNTFDGAGWRFSTATTSLRIFVLNGGVEISGSADVGAITLNKWYFLFVVRSSASTFTFYKGDETTVAASVGTIASFPINDEDAWGIGMLGSAAPGTSLHSASERWKDYARALTPTEVDAERVSLTPASVTNLNSYNALTTAGSYAGTLGMLNYTFTEQGGVNFSTVGGPSPTAPGGGGGRRGRMGLMGVGR